MLFMTFPVHVFLEETSLEALHEELRNLAGESGVRVWPDAEGSAVAQCRPPPERRVG